MATVSHKYIAESIHELTLGKSGAELQAVLKDVVRFLDKKRLLSKEKPILHFLNSLINKTEGVLEVKIISAHPITPHNKTEIGNTLKERYGVKHIKFDEKVDKELLGGVRIEIEGEVIDLSLKHKVAQLQTHLNKA